MFLIRAANRARPLQLTLAAHRAGQEWPLWPGILSLSPTLSLPPSLSLSVIFSSCNRFHSAKDQRDATYANNGAPNCALRATPELLQLHKTSALNATTTITNGIKRSTTRLNFSKRQRARKRKGATDGEGRVWAERHGNK